jgi:CotH kinase protein/Lamin Tail Domain/Chitobiase/beta-hexosaminidase C-terminal domain
MHSFFHSAVRRSMIRNGLRKSMRRSVACIFLAFFFGGVAGAVQVYVDATAGTGGNTRNHATGSLTDWSVTSSSALTTDNRWGIRTGGSAVSGFNSTTCELYTTETGAVLRTEITGLAPSSTYTGLRVYMLGSTTAGYHWTLDVSLDGSRWTTCSDYDAAGFTGTIVDTSNGGVGAPLAGTLTGTRRFWHALPDAVTNAAGVLTVYLRAGTGAGNRSVYDGIGYDNIPVSPPDPWSDSVSISEFMADNPGPVVLPGSPLDMDGDSSDWIEFHNSGTSVADLSGWKLTDDPSVPDKWIFPNGVLIAPGGRLLVFASGKNRRLPGFELHADFRLSNSGFLQLSRPAPSGPDVVLAAIGSATTGYPQQHARASYGNAAVAPAAPVWVWFPTPTPLAPNGPGVPGFVASADTDIDRGLFTAPFVVTLTCPTPGATILYTLDGSVPVEGRPSTTAVPAVGPLSPPQGTLQIRGTTVLRTRAVMSGLGPSKIDCHTYLFPAEVLGQTAPPAHFPPAAAWSHFGTADWAMDPAIVNHADPANRCTASDLMSLPSVSLVMDWSELFGVSGIYPAIAPVPEEGLGKAAHIELLNPDGSVATPNGGGTFSAAGRTHIFGGTSQDRWKVDKLSFNFNVTGTVNTDVYGDTAARSHGRFILDARMGNTWLHEWDDVQRTRGDYIRDEVAAEVQRLQGHAGTHSRRVHLYLNGMYWGLYTLHEKPDPEFQAAYQGGDPDDWDVLKHSPLRADCLGGGTFVDPALSAEARTNNTAYVNYQAMLATVATGVDLTQDANYAAVAAKLDIDDFIDYMLLNFYLGNFDWSHQNWYASFRRNHPDGRWRFHSWDAEHVLRTTTEDFSNNNQNATPTFIHQRLTTHAEYRMRFADRMHRWCFNGGLFTTARLAEVCRRQFDAIDAAMRCESARWGDNRAAARAASWTNVTYTRGVEWLNEKRRMLEEVVPARHGLILNSLKSKTLALYPRVDPANTASAVFHAPVYSQHGGRVAAGHVLGVANPNGALGTVYYTLDGSDPRLAGGALSPAALVCATGTVSLPRSATLRSRVRHGTVWSALNEAVFSVGSVAPAASNLAISKIMWKPAPPTADELRAGFSDDSDFEFLELCNTSPHTVDLTGIGFTAGLDIGFDRSGPVELAPGSRAVFVAKRSAFLMRHGPAVDVVGTFTNGSNLSGSETLTMVDATGAVIRSFAYNATATGPWPRTDTSGTGAALVLIRPESHPDPAVGANWRASLPGRSSPGKDDRSEPAAWIADHFGGPTDLAADADGDGLANLFEFAAGGDPLRADDASRRPVFFFERDPQPTLRFSYRRRKDAASLAWQLEQSVPGQSAWAVVDGGFEVLSITDHGDGTETVHARHRPGEASGTRLFRLRLTLR